MTQKFHCLGAVETSYGQAQVKLTRYPKGGALAVLLESDEGEPLATFSVNLRPYGVSTAPHEFCAKTYEENSDLVRPLLGSGWFEVTERCATAGYTTVPIWRLTNPEGVLAQLQ